MGDSKIEYVTKTWNVVTGCSPVSEGCARCWAAAYHRRWRKDFTPTFHPSKLDESLHWRKPQRIAVAFLGDLFHEKISDEQIAAVFGVMAAARQHTFLLATKRAARMQAWFARPNIQASVELARRNYVGDGTNVWERWPLPNVWLGVSAEDQPRLDERLSELMATPAAHRWVSLEPCLGPVDLDVVPCRACNHPVDIVDHRRRDVGADRLACLCSRCQGRRYEWPDWVVCGGESAQGGQPARPCDVGWIRSVVEQCGAAGVPVYVKQLGSAPRFSSSDRVFWQDVGDGRLLRHPRGADPEEWPADLRVRELPAGSATEAKPS